MPPLKRVDLIRPRVRQRPDPRRKGSPPISHGSRCCYWWYIEIWKKNMETTIFV